MGRELQKKKNKSSISKVRQKPKSKKKVLNNAIIAANWNQKETLTQNYRRLGLASKLNTPSGGTEKTSAILQENAANNNPADTLSIHSKLPKMVDVSSEVRIIRDPKTGAILEVLDEDDKRKPNPLNDSLNDLEDSSDEEEWQGFGTNEHGVIDGPAPTGEAKTQVIRELEEQASRAAPKKIRQQSERESDWIAELVEKHGDDYLAMSRDMKLNPMQQSVGDLKKRVKKWMSTQ